MSGFHVVRAPDVPRTEAGSAIVQGASYNTPISFFVVESDREGMGAALHTHPYAEVFLVRGGRALAMAGEDELELAAGDVLFVEAGTPHGFRNIGPEPLEMVTIHGAGEMQTTWL